jgi:hypothetical protein
MDVVGSIDPLYVLSGFCVGALVGMTGVGGGSLMTPLQRGSRARAPSWWSAQNVVRVAPPATPGRR